MTEAPGPDQRASARAFRSDINGLRAIALLAVLAFHFGLAPAQGGFVGVDIFYVISGYLMTGIILGRIERGTFSLLAFYLDRARRIVPALAVLVAALLALGALILLPDEFASLARQAWASLLFVSNILFWRETPYFDPAVDQKWLLHSWSLSLEWQFYLLYPLVLPLLARWLPRRRLVPVLAGAALLSFAAMVVLGGIAPGAAFYLLPPRAWELLAGALVYLAPPLQARWSRAAEGAGLALILGSILLIGEAGWPGPLALAPVVGTMLVLSAARTDSPFTGNAAARWIGLASYSLYLWHWPIVVGLRRSGHGGDWRWIAAGLALTLLLGLASWRFVERRAAPHAAAPHIRVAGAAGSWRALAPYGLAVAALVLASLAVARSGGLPQRFSPEVRAVAEASRRVEVAGAAGCFSTGSFTPRLCRLGPDSAPLLAVFVGDSHAEAQLAGLVAALPSGGRGAIAFSALASCPPVLDPAPAGRGGRCAGFIASILEPLAAPRRTPLILGASWGAYSAGNDPRFEAAFLRSTCALAAAGPTFVVLPTPRFPFWVGRELQRRLAADPDAPDIAVPRAAHDRANRRILGLLRAASRRCGVRLLDPVPFLCRDNLCDGSRRHRPLYRDEHHLTAYGARLLAPMFREALRDE